MKRLINIVLCFIVFLLSCRSGKIIFKPPDSRQVHSIEIADGDEAALLQQQAGLTIKNIEGNKLYYFFQTNNQEEQLIKTGYKISPENSMQVFYKLVQLYYKNKAPGESQQEAIKKNGIEIINKEEKYWVVRGTLEQLNQIQKQGYKLKIPNKEVRPRRVEIIVADAEDIQKVNDLGVDIYSSEKNKGRGYIIYAGAFDFEIEKMQAVGYQVTRKD